MPRYTQQEATCRVWTLKEGLLSRVAHDLVLDVREFRIDVSDGGAIVARFAADSLAVVDAVVDGSPRAGILSDRDKGKIAKNIRNDVLHSARFPAIVFEAPAPERLDETRLRVTGELDLHGVRRELSALALRHGERAKVSCRIHQPDFDIVPYSAALGTLRVQPQVRVELDLPWPAG